MPRIIELKEIDEIALGHINASRAKHEMPPFKDVMQANHCEMLWGLRNAVKESLLKREIVEDKEEVANALAYMQGQTHFEQRYYKTITDILKVIVYGEK